MSKDRNDKEDAFSRLQYRRYVAWSSRIQREAPLILETLGRTPGRKVLDLGCGTGEHSRFLAEQGFQVVGIDLSETLLAEARSEEISRIQYMQSDLRDLAGLNLQGFEGAVCLGNTLVNLQDESGLERFAQGLSQSLLPGARLLVQILNYAGLRKRNVRYLPLNFLHEEEEERVFLRMMQFCPDGMVRFYPTTLRLNPGSETPVEVIHTREVELKGWELGELKPILEKNGFRVVRILGDMVDAPFEAVESGDLVLIAERS
jgi:SAM-dependent methyltransferase